MRLQKEWYARLKEEGFRDIEWTDDTGKSDSPYLKGANTVAMYRKLQYGLEEYYRVAGWYLHDTEFWKTSDEYTVWHLHVHGVDGPRTAVLMDRPKSYVYSILRKHQRQLRELYGTRSREEG
ncbi:MAG: hypothetical protein GWN58_58625 [Anaerolineae bacterium]|nr:hypothetical protein [Anaerolineae bacterium]